MVVVLNNPDVVGYNIES